MDNLNNLCMSCMTHGLSVGGTCSNCGADEGNVWVASHHLRPRTLLNGKYLVGRAIGEGGFGITYVGWDEQLSLKVAIKEYYPNGFVTRDSTSSSAVHSYSGEKGEFYNQGRDRFIEEARRLARFFGLPGIVAVKDFFTENGTAYIVMEFVEGATMRTVLSSMGGHMREEYVLEIMKPLIRSLAGMHRSGIIHRDIAPDNIMIQPDGSVKLLDFGAAREVATDGKSSAAIMKHGYAPEEQYDPNRTRQGPWTDVYAICATIFRAIEGDTPPDAIARLRKDTLNGFMTPVSENTRRVVTKGLAVAPEDRWQDIDELARELYPPVEAGFVPKTAYAQQLQSVRDPHQIPDSQQVPVTFGKVKTSTLICIGWISVIIFILSDLIYLGRFATFFPSLFGSVAAVQLLVICLRIIRPKKPFKSSKFLKIVGNIAAGLLAICYMFIVYVAGHLWGLDAFTMMSGISAAVLIGLYLWLINKSKTVELPTSNVTPESPCKNQGEQMETSLFDIRNNKLRYLVITDAVAVIGYFVYVVILMNVEPIAMLITLLALAAYVLACILLVNRKKPRMAALTVGGLAIAWMTFCCIMWDSVLHKEFEIILILLGNVFILVMITTFVRIVKKTAKPVAYESVSENGRAD